MSKKSVAVTGMAALVAGIVIGSAGTAESNTTAAPQVKTVTETVVPQGCLDAIDAAESIMGDETPKFAQVTIAYIDLVQRALMAGMDMDVAEANRIADKVRHLSRKTNGITQRLDPLIADFKAGRATCH